MKRDEPVSAQLIAALRRRADKLEDERDPLGYGPECGLNRYLAAEFRKLADEAELGVSAATGEESP